MSSKQQLENSGNEKGVCRTFIRRHPRDNWAVKLDIYTPWEKSLDRSWTSDGEYMSRSGGSVICFG